MEPYITVTTPDGWRKEFLLEGNLIYVGSAPDNNIMLGDPTRGVSSRHLQIIAMPGGYRAVNLGDYSILVDDAEIQPRFAVDVGDGSNLKLGDFDLTFRFDQVIGTTIIPQKGTNAIGLALSLPRTVVLAPDQPVDGTIVIRNLGTESGVQFQIELEGLEEDCYEMGPGPILFPNAEKEVFLRLYHPRRPHPPAGEHQITIRASAPDAYPGQSAVEPRQINILPYYDHTLRLLGADKET